MRAASYLQTAKSVMTQEGPKAPWQICIYLEAIQDCSQAFLLEIIDPGGSETQIKLMNGLWILARLLAMTKTSYKFCCHAVFQI
jgi:hypothetical protein